MEISYKPGWKVWIEGELLRVEAPSTCAYTKKPYVLRYTVGHGDTPAGVRAALQRLEDHETDEWLHIDGVRVRESHAPGVDPDPGRV